MAKYVPLCQKIQNLTAFSEGFKYKRPKVQKENFNFLLKESLNNERFQNREQRYILEREDILNLET